ncbi:MAG: hypothetical protein ACRD1T_13705, partial [Acidimicrobiia bacterium]
VGTGSAFEGLGYGRVVLTATDSTQYAWEGDELVDSDKSVFTHYLVRGLKTGEADRDADGVITLDELYDYIYEHVVSDTPKQTPGKWSYMQQGDIVIARNRHPIARSSDLPVEVRTLIESALPRLRVEALPELATLLRSRDPRMVLAARVALEGLRTDDSRRVAAATQEVLTSFAAEASPPTPTAAEAEAEPDAEASLEYHGLAKRGSVRELVEYANAKVVLVGDSGVGKSGLALVLTGQPFSPTESTHGRNVRRFDSHELSVGSGRTEIRETVLWDLAGQPGYRLVHQLDLSEIAAALVVFDARSETDPLSGALHWVRALRQAESPTGGCVHPKFLVAARIDRGGLAISRERVDDFMRAFQFHGYFETSAKEGSNIAALRKAIQQAIDWSALPRVGSNTLFERIKSFISDEQKARRVLSTMDDLYRLFLNTPEAPEASDTLRTQFETCLG